MHPSTRKDEDSACTALTLLNLERICLFLGATPSLLPLVKEYVGTISVFFVFFTVSYNLEVQVKANGAPHISTLGVISCGLMNVILDYVFVILIPWGVFGAAFATGLSQMTSTTVFVIYFLKHKERLRLGKFKWNLRDYRRILPLGLSDGLTELSNGIVIFLFNITILRVIGEKALVSYTIINYVATMVLMTMKFVRAHCLLYQERYAGPAFCMPPAGPEQTPVASAVHRRTASRRPF